MTQRFVKIIKDEVEKHLHTKHLKYQKNIKNEIEQFTDGMVSFRWKANNVYKDLCNIPADDVEFCQLALSLKNQTKHDVDAFRKLLETKEILSANAFSNYSKLIEKIIFKIIDKHSDQINRRGKAGCYLTALRKMIANTKHSEMLRLDEFIEENFLLFKDELAENLKVILRFRKILQEASKNYLKSRDAESLRNFVRFINCLVLTKSLIQNLAF